MPVTNCIISFVVSNVTGTVSSCLTYLFSIVGTVATTSRRRYAAVLLDCILKQPCSRNNNERDELNCRAGARSVSCVQC
jgi:threonine/homoserine efflux transporter RhtA